MQYRAVMGVSSTGGRSKNGIFRGWTVKNDRNRHENDVYCGASLCFLAMYARKVPFLPQPPVDDTALTAVYGISSEKLLKYYINIVLYSR